MRSIPLEAKRYFRSRPFSAVPRGQRREHKLRSGVWSRIRVMDGSLTIVEARAPAPEQKADGLGHIRRIVATGEQIDVEPGIFHHLEPAGPHVRFVVHLYRLSPDARASEHVARWENEGGGPRAGAK